MKAQLEDRPEPASAAVGRAWLCFVVWHRASRFIHAKGSTVYVQGSMSHTKGCPKQRSSEHHFAVMYLEFGRVCILDDSSEAVQHPRGDAALHLQPVLDGLAFHTVTCP